MTDPIPYRPLPRDLRDVHYAHGPDSMRRAEVPAGSTTVLDLPSSAVFPGTHRRVHVHVPATVDQATDAALVVVQDGSLYLDPEGEVRAGIVLDNLCHRGAIPPTVGVLVDSGTRDREAPPGAMRQRNVEYDADDDAYVRFLEEEVLPLVEQRHRITRDPARRAICGGSSGGNASFTAAWHRPDLFGVALCFLASFAQMPGGNPYPALLPAVERRALRVLLQIGHRDLGHDRAEMNWLAENLRTGAALAEAGYDVRLVLGDGGHSPNHGGVLLPDALRWAFGDAGPAAAKRR
ncbi:alpha/beta hydrolase [Brachybacterium hainanense]|uniref:Alpha/beta hydrolase n=1 Tax=Brachybacterium hainanense TaxID=1541174 RepID=A0ABV6RB04_9MICO